MEDIVSPESNTPQHNMTWDTDVIPSFLAADSKTEARSIALI